MATTPDPADGPAPDPARSGDDIVEAVREAERGSAVDDVHTRPEQSRPGHAPVEQSAGDPAMTEGQVIGEEPSGEAREPGPAPAASGSGGAQSVVGGRTSDRLAAGEPPPGSA